MGVTAQFLSHRKEKSECAVWDDASSTIASTKALSDPTKLSCSLCDDLYKAIPHAHLLCQQQNAAECHQQNAGHARKKQGLYFKNAAFYFAISKIPDKIHQDRHIFIHTIRKGRGDKYLVHSYCFHLIAGISFWIFAADLAARIQTFIS